MCNISRFPPGSPVSHHGQKKRFDHDADTEWHATRSTPEGEKLHHETQLSLRKTSASGSAHDSGVEDSLDEEFDSFENFVSFNSNKDSRFSDSDYGDHADGDLDCYEDEEEYCPTQELAPRRHRTRRQGDFQSASNRENGAYYQGNPEIYNSPESYMKDSHEASSLKPTKLVDKIKNRLCDYQENPIMFVRLGCSVALHTLMGAMLASTFLGAGMTLGITAPIVGTIAIPVLTIGAIGGAIMGFHNDFVLDKPLLPKDFNWLDGLTRTTYLPKYTLPRA